MGSWVCVGSWTKHKPIYYRRAALERRDSVQSEEQWWHGRMRQLTLSSHLKATEESAQARAKKNSVFPVWGFRLNGFVFCMDFEVSSFVTTHMSMYRQEMYKIEQTLNPGTVKCPPTFRSAICENPILQIITWWWVCAQWFWFKHVLLNTECQFEGNDVPRLRSWRNMMMHIPSLSTIWCASQAWEFCWYNWQRPNHLHRIPKGPQSIFQRLWIPDSGLLQKEWYVDQDR